MEPKVIFLIGSAGSGKSTIGKWIAKEYNYCYLDKDVVCNTFTGALLTSKGYSPHDRDGCDFYSDVVMDLEYETLLNIANDNLMLGRSVVLDAPFLSYFSRVAYINELREKYGWNRVKALVLRVVVDFDILKGRMEARGLDRDVWKLEHWDTFVQGIKEKQCLWEDVAVREYDNSDEEINVEQLHFLLRQDSSHKDITAG
ncbi:AAA family ATPase [Paenibacillus sp. KS-LC4]|uniref:AAA family ATPase n=1 Tax=Paenibacillus sp. KS-LC4 TaxID=2979727 RepID=UPI0030D1C2BE